MAIDLTPEQRAVGEENFKTTVEKLGLNRRDFIKAGILGAGALGGSAAAVWFGYQSLQGKPEGGCRQPRLTLETQTLEADALEIRVVLVECVENIDQAGFEGLPTVLCQSEKHPTRREAHEAKLVGNLRRGGQRHGPVPGKCREIEIIGPHRSDRGLLQHDFGEPDVIRVGEGLARRGAPWERSGMNVVPGKKFGCGIDGHGRDMPWSAG